MFVEDCRIWIHGPVYPGVYDLFRDFKYNPIEDSWKAARKGYGDSIPSSELLPKERIMKYYVSVD